MHQYCTPGLLKFRNIDLPYLEEILFFFNAIRIGKFSKKITMDQHDSCISELKKSHIHVHITCIM